MNGLIQQLLHENKNKFIVTGYSQAVKTRVERSAPVSTDFMEHCNFF